MNMAKRVKKTEAVAVVDCNSWCESRAVARCVLAPLLTEKRLKGFGCTFKSVAGLKGFKAAVYEAVADAMRAK